MSTAIVILAAAFFVLFVFLFAAGLRACVSALRKRGSGEAGPEDVLQACLLLLASCACALIVFPYGVIFFRWVTTGGLGVLSTEILLLSAVLCGGLGFAFLSMRRRPVGGSRDG
jgi:hypothetical protein